MKLILRLRFIILATLILFINNAHANQFSSINVNSLNIAKTNEIYDFFRIKLPKVYFMINQTLLKSFLKMVIFKLNFLMASTKVFIKANGRLRIIVFALNMILLIILNVQNFCINKIIMEI